MIVFSIPMRTPTLNVWQRLHWAKRGRIGRDMAWAIRAAVAPPAKPWKRVRIHVERESTKAADYDGMVGGLKPLLDALQPASKRHPHGLGFIEDDGPHCLVGLEVVHVAGKGQRTTVRIEQV